MRELLADRNYRAYFFGFLLGDLGIQMQYVAVGWQVYQLHHRAFDLALVGLVSFLPTFVFALPAGVFVDRNDRRIIAVAGCVLESLLYAGFCALVALHVRDIVPYLTLLGAQGTVRAFSAPAERSLLPSIVEPAKFLPASATYSSARELMVIAGPAAGGALVAFGAPVASAVAAILLFSSSAIIATLRIAPLDSHVAPPTLRDAFGGVRFIASKPAIAGAISLDLFAVLFGGVDAVLPIYADTILRIGPIGLGALRGAPAAGAVAVAYWVSRHPPRRHIGVTLLCTIAIFGAATIVFGISRWLPLSLVMLMLIGGSDMVSVVIRNGLVQLGTPSDMRGRVNAVENVFIGASNQLGAFESGGLAALLGTVPSVVAGGLGTLVVIALWAALFPGLRKADRLEETLPEIPVPTG